MDQAGRRNIPQTGSEQRTIESIGGIERSDVARYVSYNFQLIGVNTTVLEQRGQRAWVRVVYNDLTSQDPEGVRWVGVVWINDLGVPQQMRTPGVVAGRIFDGGICLMAETVSPLGFTPRSFTEWVLIDQRFERLWIQGGLGLEQEATEFQVIIEKR